MHWIGRQLCRISPRWHLRAICLAVGIVPYVWQRSFALGRLDSLPGKHLRGNGKTTAAMLRLLMLPQGADRSTVLRVLECDPDWPQGVGSRSVRTWYARRYRELWLRCVYAHVPVSDLSVSDFLAL